MKRRVLYSLLPIMMLGFCGFMFEKPIVLTDWENVAELQEFLGEDNTDARLFLRANKDGVIKFNGQCEDRALRLIDNAMAKGKRLHFVPLNYMEYRKWYGEHVSSSRYHAIAGALVGDNEFWYIEPSTDQYWRAILLD